MFLTNTPFTITTFGEDQAGELYLGNYIFGGSGAIYKIVWKDSDGDGMPDDSELLAGTDPNDPASLLRVSTTGPSDADWAVTFNTVTNKLYRLERTDDLQASLWTNVTGTVVGTGNPITVVDPNAAVLSQRFYRVRLLP